MNALAQDVALLRRLYTGESVQQARKAIRQLREGAAPIPAATSPAQRHLEARVFLCLLENRHLYTRYPLGITAVHPEPEGIAIHLESEQRATEVLFNLLPAHAPGQELHGLAGLRITRRDQTAIELRVLGQPTRLRLHGLPSRLWRSAETGTLDRWVDPDTMRLCWRSSPRAWTPTECEHHARYEDDSDSYVQLHQRGSWLGSGLLRRAALLHTVANTYLLDGYRGDAVAGARLVIRSSHVRGHGPGPHHIVSALLDPICGLPLQVARFRGDTDERYGSDQHFVLEDPDKTNLLDLRASIEQPPSNLGPELWDSIIRRLPSQGFTNGAAPGSLVALCGRAAP
ncbi:hypothetical protein G4Z16_01050 [Streptomyces bathyalis]|uniref:Uncharacterized protein n=1 Tax=Streptomyces bathyalis TaxID=2710756 RepID=A0A7T1T2I3_9ACTN|nr:hypothetical protein [Streptomyces bathyalis]QPP05205.1 hypothetical protein G4Z16_01050 [Streptomyces bathyalis]